MSWSAAALLVSACGSSPSAPTALAPPAPAATEPAPQPSTITRRLTGFIRDDANRAVAGASVTAHGASGARRTTTSDSNGFYEVMADIHPQVAVYWVTVDVTKPGYEQTQNGALFRNHEDATADFYLFELTRVQPGTVARLVISFDGPLCGFELEYACRHVQIETSSAGTLTIEATPDDPAITLRFGPVGYPAVSSPSRLTIGVRAGQTVAAEILMVSRPLGPPGTRSQPFTLTTTLAP